MDRLQLRATLGCVALVAVIALILLVTIDPSQEWGGDNSMYIMHAINIATGQPYNATGYIQNPASYLAPQAYPPMFPVLLAPVYALYGIDFHAMKVFMVALFVLSLCAIAYCYKDEFSGRYATLYWLLLVAVVGLHPRIAHYSNTVLSDVPFLLFVYLSLIALKQAYSRLDESAGNLTRCVAAGFCMYLAMGTRVFGFLLLGSAVAYELIRYRRLTRVALVGTTVSLLCYAVQQVMLHQAHTAVGGADQGYGAIVQSDFFERLWSLPAIMMANLVDYAYRLQNGLAIGIDSDLAVTLGVLTLLLGAFGFVRHVLSRYAIVDVFVVVYILGLLPWTSVEWRYMLPIVPAFCFYVTVALIALQRHWRYPVLVAAIAGLIGVGYSIDYAPRLRASAQISSSAPNSSGAFELYRYIERHTRTDDVIIFVKPRILALYTGRRAATYSDESDQHQFDYFNRLGARYLLTGPPDWQDHVQGLVQRHPGHFQKIFSNNEFRLYTIASADPEPVAAPDNQSNDRYAKPAKKE